MLKQFAISCLSLLAFSAHAESDLRTIATGTKFQCTSNHPIATLKKKINGFPVLCVVKADILSTSTKQLVISAQSRLLGWTDNGVNAGKKPPQFGGVG
ncbi:hypothetical protein ACO0LB_16985 [Undibacterium sp. SXout7W]|uniref:hypothetical protein n=1 Tax=Undibacterium sp. SXout7W TaxID=3413049 RepID=UPI003BF2AD5F